MKVCILMWLTKFNQYIPITITILEWQVFCQVYLVYSAQIQFKSHEPGPGRQPFSLERGKLSK